MTLKALGKRKTEQMIIWGAGVIGLRLQKFLGDYCIGFIDGDINKQGTVINGCPVISFEQYLEDYKGISIVVSMLVPSNAVNNLLKENSIKNTYYACDCPDTFYEYNREDVLNIIHERMIFSGNVAYVYGDNLLMHLYMDRYDEENIVLVGGGEQPLEINSVVNIVSSHLHDAKKFCEAGYACNFPAKFNELRTLFANPNIRKLHNIYKGQRCFVVATGPSLCVEDLELLKENEERCISMNSITDAFQFTDWRPDFYVTSDVNAIKNLKKVKRDLQSSTIVATDSEPDFFDSKESGGIERIHMMFCGDEIAFSDDLEKCVYSASTVTYVCLQLAVYLGFKDIYLIGLDFTSTSQHFIDDKISASDRETMVAIDEDFYEIQREIWKKGYVSAREYAKSHDVNIYNATRGGELEVFERVNFESLF